MFNTLQYEIIETIAKSVVFVGIFAISSSEISHSSVPWPGYLKLFWMYHDVLTWLSIFLHEPVMNHHSLIEI